jgi:putative flippase GtrA
MLGFWLNDRYTFAQAGQSRLGWRRLRRFVPSWLLLTLLSTLVMVGIGRTLGLQAAWLGKPLVEVVFAAISFVVWRHWVYR